MTLLKSTRDGIGEGLLEAGKINPEVVVLTADLKESTRVDGFAQEFPERFFDCGVAEQALVTIASGMANYGKIPFITSFAIFSPGRTWEQIRTTICLNDVPVKIIGSHVGLSSGLDGGNHQCLEDIALMRVLPNMVVLVPCDFEETKKAVLAAVKNNKPTYIRVQREPQPVITTAKSPFKIGKANIMLESKNPAVSIFACGAQVNETLQAVKELKNVNVINLHTIKPLDEAAIIRAAKLSGAVVTVEEHQQAGGMSSAIAEVLARNYPAPMEMVVVKDKFGESGKYTELLAKHNLTKKGIIEAVKKVLDRKNS